MGKPYTEFQKGIAFDTYYAMGEARDLITVSQQLVGSENFTDRSPSERTLFKWSTENNWQNRLTQRDIVNSRKVEADTDYQIVKAVVNTKADYRTELFTKRGELSKLRQRYEKLVGDATEAIKKGEIKVESIKDLTDLATALSKLDGMDNNMIKLDLLLIGEDTTEGNVIVNFIGMEDDPFPEPFETEESE